MTTTETDRYIATVLRHLPQRKRAEVERELRALIADELQARTEAGEPDAEQAVLRGLGEPELLAERYAPGPRVLLSRRVFATWAKTTRWLCGIVLPIVYIVLAVVHAAHGDNLGAIIFLPLGVTITVGMYLLVGNTALFALVDHHDSRLGSGLQASDDAEGGRP